MHGTIASLVGLVLLAGAIPCSGQSEDVVAIDVVIEPDSAMVTRAVAINARLRQHYPAGFALDAAHAPHITLVQRYVRTADIEAIGAAVGEVLATERVLPLQLTASGYGGTVWAGVGLVDYTFEPSEALRRLAEAVVAVVEPFAVRGGTGQAFQRAPGEQINAPTIAYVEEFVARASGPNYRPHVTVGNAQPGFLRTLQGEPFERFDFAGSGVAIYQLGNFGTAQRRLWSWQADSAPRAATTPAFGARSHMSVLLAASPAFAALLAAILGAFVLGRRIGRARLARDGERAFAGSGAMEGAVFALLGLLLAFSFAHAAERFDKRRDLIIEETNALGTAWLRLDLLHESVQPEVRTRFQQYVRMRLAAYASFPDVPLVTHRLDSATAMQPVIWGLAVTGAQRQPTAAPAQLVLPALNAVFDIATTRQAAFAMHTPAIVFVMLTVLVLVSSLLAGVTAAANPAGNRVHTLAFALLLVASLYLIFELEFPRFGFVRIDDFDRHLAGAVPGLELPR